jgi:hypothetical protein
MMRVYYLNFRGNLGRKVREQAQALLARPMMKELDLPAKSGGPARALMRKLGIEGV